MCRQIPAGHNAFFVPVLVDDLPCSVGHRSYHESLQQSAFCLCLLLFFLPAGHDGVFVPLLVDDLPRFMDAFQGHDFQVRRAHVAVAHLCIPVTISQHAVPSMCATALVLFSSSYVYVQQGHDFQVGLTRAYMPLINSNNVLLLKFVQQNAMIAKLVTFHSTCVLVMFDKAVI
jgi:hypothetical protein